MNEQGETFEAWLCREMPAGTVIGDPKWWAPKILNALAHRDKQAEPVAFLRVKAGKIIGSSVHDEMADGVYAVHTHPAPAVAVNEQMLEALKAIREWADNCGAQAGADAVISQADDAIAAAEAAKLADPTNTVVEPEHKDVDTWCRYIAGMILCGADVFKGGLSEDAIAGIIKRRLCFLPHPPSPAVRLHLVKPAYSDGLHIKQWDNLGQLGEGVHELYLRGGQS